MSSINQLKSMLELQAIKNFSNSTSSIEQSTNTNTLFQEILATALQETMNNSNENSSLSLNNIKSYLPMNMSTVSQSSSVTARNTLSEPKNIDSIIQKAVDQYDLPSELIKSVIQQESNFNPDAVSGSGASGLMQLMPSTARSLGVTNVFDPEQNVLAGSRYLKNMLDRYNGNIELALAAYNAGPGNVDRYGGIPPFKETQKYVQNITNRFYS